MDAKEFRAVAENRMEVLFEDTKNDLLKKINLLAQAGEVEYEEYDNKYANSLMINKLTEYFKSKGFTIYVGHTRYPKFFDKEYLIKIEW